MSRQNKVNPGMYTQRGRLTQDDAARELRKQRSAGSQHTWQPVKKDQLPRLESKASAEGTETTEDEGTSEETPISAKTRAASRATTEKMAPVKAKAKSSKARSAKTGQAQKSTGKAKPASGKAKSASGKAKSGKAAKAAAKQTAAKPQRKAVLARNVGGLRLRSGQPRAESRGGGGATPRPAAKRRKS